MGERDDTAENINREQEDGPQAQDIADEARRPAPAGETVRGPSGWAEVLPQDTPDLVDNMNAMVRSGRIDNDAFAGEPQHDDEEDILGETDSQGDDEGGVFNPAADGSEDPLAVPVGLGGGEDPLAEVASEHGLEGDGSDDVDLDEDDDDDENEDEDEESLEIDIERDRAGRIERRDV